MKPSDRTLGLYRQIFQNMSDAAAVVDKRWRYIDRNDAHRRLFGYDDRRIYRMSPADIVGRRRFQAACRTMLSTGEFRGELACRAVDGRLIQVETVFFPVRDETGRAIAYAACHRDIGPRKAWEEQLRRATEALRFQKSVLESQSEASIDGILVVSRDGRILSCNRQFSEMWGLPPEVLAKGSDSAALRYALPQIVMPGRFLAGVRRLYRKPRERSRYEIHLKDGRTFDRYSAPVLAEDGSILGRVWYFRDTTAERRAQEAQRRSADAVRRALAELKRAQGRIIRNEKLALMGMLVSGVAHEINNPINVVYGNLSLLRDRWEALARMARGGRASKETRRAIAAVPPMLRDALKAAGDARNVIAEFRNFSHDPRTAEPMDLNQCVRETLAMARKDLARLRVRRTLGKTPPVRGFHGQMNQVLLNLVKNAAEAMDGKGTLTITTGRRGRGARVTVSDTGPGIPQADRDRIFDPFFTTKDKGRGFGLGLAMSAAIVQNHGGTLTLRTRPGRGSSFSIELPSVS